MKHSRTIERTLQRSLNRALERVLVREVERAQERALIANKAVEASWASEATKSNWKAINRWSTVEITLKRSLNRAQEREYKRKH